MKRDERGTLNRATLRWLTVWGPTLFLGLVAGTVLYLHPHPLPFWIALLGVLALSAAGAHAFSRFVFAYIQRQEEELIRRNQELAAVNQAVAVLRERHRIAREMHDSLAQDLGYLHLKLADVHRRLGSGETEQVAAELGQLRRVAREAYEEVRQAIFGLRAMVSRSGGLIPALTEYLNDFSRQTGITVDLKIGDEEAVRFSPRVEVQLIRIIQETLTNVRKHAEAGRVLVSFERDGEVAKVTIQDDGRGFDTAGVARQGEGYFGLEMMRERAESVGGAVAISSAPGRGTRVEVRVPMDGQKEGDQ